jgi:hypothetical protein
MNIVFAIEYWIGLFFVFTIFGLSGIYGTSLILSALKLCRYYSRALGVVVGSLLGFALLGMVPLFMFN